MSPKKSGNFIEPANWEELQHYKHRSPPWIKLHKKLLDNYDYHCLPDASRALAPLLWLLSSEFDDGRITWSFDQIAFRLHITEQNFVTALKPLIDKGFFHDASGMLADRKQNSSTEKESETETEAELELESETELSPSATSPKKGKSKKPLKLSPPPPPEPKRRPTRLDISTPMSTKNLEDAKQSGLTTAEATKEWVRFRNRYSAATGATGQSYDWDAVWHNWALRVAGELKREPVFTEVSTAPPKVPERPVSDWRRFMRVFVQTGNWLDAWGPKPDDPGCVVPDEVLKEFKLGKYDENAED